MFYLIELVPPQLNLFANYDFSVGLKKDRQVFYLWVCQFDLILFQNSFFQSLNNLYICSKIHVIFAFALPIKGWFLLSSIIQKSSISYVVTIQLQTNQIISQDSLWKSASLKQNHCNVGSNFLFGNWTCFGSRVRIVLVWDLLYHKYYFKIQESKRNCCGFILWK